MLQDMSNSERMDIPICLDVNGEKGQISII